MGESLSRKPRYATAGNPTMQAVLGELFRFASESDAHRQLDMVAGRFVTSRQHVVDAPQPSVHLWIKGFGVSEAETAQGVIGHFALIACKRVEEERWTLYAKKIDTPVTQHPQRAQVQRGNPNWGHPVLRSQRKGKTYATQEDAQAELDLLHRQFPNVSVPNPAKLYIMIYCSQRPPKERMVKHVLDIALLPNGKYIINCRENERKTYSKNSISQSKTPIRNEGYFTAKLALARTRKSKIPTSDAT